MVALCRRVLITGALSLALVAVPAGALGQTYGSKLDGAPNAGHGCELAPVADLNGMLVPTPTGQASCTYRHLGYLDQHGTGSIVPGNGRITDVWIRSGANPAPVQITLLGVSTRVDGAGNDVPGSFSCCTASYVGPAFTPEPNAVTHRQVDIPVRRTIEAGSQYTDAIALSFPGPGSLPLRITDPSGSLVAGTPIVQHFHSSTRVGQPRVDGYSAGGVDLLFQWRFEGAASFSGGTRTREDQRSSRRFEEPAQPVTGTAGWRIATEAGVALAGYHAGG